jgi:hypothetical protein
LPHHALSIIYTQNPSYGGVEFYTGKGDELRFENAQLDKIEYVFWEEEFASVWIHSIGYANWLDLHDAAIAEFGEGYKPHIYIEQYHWYGVSTMILLQYNQIRREGTLCLFSQRIIKQQEEYYNQKRPRRRENGCEIDIEVDIKISISVHLDGTTHVDIVLEF